MRHSMEELTFTYICSASQPAATGSMATTATAGLFPKPAETGTSTPTPVASTQTGGSIFGNTVFGKKPDGPTAQAGTTPAPPSTPLFTGFGAKKDDAADKDKQQSSGGTTPATGEFLL